MFLLTMVVIVNQTMSSQKRMVVHHHHLTLILTWRARSRKRKGNSKSLKLTFWLIVNQWRKATRSAKSVGKMESEKILLCCRMETPIMRRTLFQTIAALNLSLHLHPDANLGQRIQRGAQGPRIDQLKEPKGDPDLGSGRPQDQGNGKGLHQDPEKGLDQGKGLGLDQGIGLALDLGEVLAPYPGKGLDQGKDLGQEGGDLDRESALGSIHQGKGSIRHQPKSCPRISTHPVVEDPLDRVSEGIDPKIERKSIKREDIPRLAEEVVPPPLLLLQLENKI